VHIVGKERRTENTLRESLGLNGMLHSILAKAALKKPLGEQVLCGERQNLDTYAGEYDSLPWRTGIVPTQNLFYADSDANLAVVLLPF
jgi:hypothetical protein